MIYILCTISDVFFATQSELFQGLNARRGAELSKKDLSDDLDQLLNTGLFANVDANVTPKKDCLLYTSPSPRDKRQSRMPSSA